MSLLRLNSVLLAALFFAATLRAQVPDSLATLRLESSKITERIEKPLFTIKEGVSGEVSVDKIRAIPSILGAADPVRFIRLLPSVQMNSETDAGLYMQGTEYSHTMLSIGGVPVYGGTHMFGLFSVFNPTHYKSMEYSTDAGQKARLGGVINMTLPDSLARRIGADISLGMLSCQGTLRIPLGSWSTLYVSARRTLINLFYGRYLRFADQPIVYGFTDANLTWYARPSARDRLWVDIFGGRDSGNFTYGENGMSMQGGWYNGLASVHWDHYFSAFTLKQTAYCTRYGMNSHLYSDFLEGHMPSHIQKVGYSADALWNGWDFGASAAWFQAQPQNPRTSGHYNATNTGSEPRQDAMETILTTTYSRPLGYYLILKGGLGVNFFLNDRKQFFWGLTPQLEATVNLMEGGRIGARYGIHRQNIFQTGMTNMGLPVEFWVLAGEYSAPQWSHNVSLSYNLDLFKGKWAISSELYFKRLYNQLEYKGTLMEMFNGNYSLENSLLKGDGYAYGVNLMLQRKEGRLTGWVGYAFGRSLRRFDDPAFPGLYPSDHERLHEVNLVVTYDFGRFDVGGTFVAASGTPYTRAESFYIIGDRMICNYGERNACRLPPYIRLDISGNWFFIKNARREGGLNLSIYNVLCRENAVGYGLKVNMDEQSYQFRPTTFGIKFMPSLAVFYRF